MSSETTNSEYIVLRTWIKNEQIDGWRYIRSFRGINDWTHTVNPREALQFDLDDPSEIIGLFDKIAASIKATQPLEIVKVSVTTDIEVVGMDNEQLLEERRRVAIGKLNRQDIEALGIGHLASYTKLKYHGGPNG